MADLRIANFANIDRAALTNALGQVQIEKQGAFNRLAPQIARGDETATRQGLALAPEQTAQVVQALAGLDKIKRDELARTTQEAARSLFALEQIPEAQRPQAYRQWLAMAQQKGWVTADDPMPPEYDPAAVRGQINEAMTLEQLIKQAEGTVLGPGQRLVSNAGETIASVPPKPDTQLQEVYDPNSPTGTRFVPRAEAAGQPGKPPSGMEITTPEGTTIRTGVRSGAGGMSKPTATKLEEEIRTSQAGIQRLAQIKSRFKPEYLTLPTKIAMAYSRGKELIGMDLSPEEETALAGYSAFQRDAVDSLNRYIKEITGAQMSEAEADRIRKGIPDPENDSPTQFKAKMDASVKSLQLASARASFALQHGLTPKTIPLDSMPQLIDNRGAELEAEIRQQNPGMPVAQIREQVKTQLKAEFGL